MSKTIIDKIKNSDFEFRELTNKTVICYGIRKNGLDNKYNSFEYNTEENRIYLFFPYLLNIKTNEFTQIDDTPRRGRNITYIINFDNEYLIREITNSYFDYINILNLYSFVNNYYEIFKHIESLYYLLTGNSLIYQLRKQKLKKLTYGG